MKNLRKLFALIAVVSFAATSCSKELAIEPGQTFFEKNGSWGNCAEFESFQDVYEFEFKAGTIIFLDVTNITGKSVASIAIYGPNSNLGGTNILTGTTDEASCSGQNESEIIDKVEILDGGVHKIAITRNWGTSSGYSGEYELTILSSEKFIYNSQIVDDVDSKGSGISCPG